MMMTEQMIMEEARKYMQPAAQIRAERPVRVPQMRIRLMETGIEYGADMIRNRKDLEKFCVRLNEDEAFEKFSVIAVNAQCRPIGIYSIMGALSEVNAYPRVITTFALLANAHSVFLTHNHPGGTCAPSTDDITSTVRIQRILRELGIMVLDHLITTPEGQCYSMAQHGDISIP